MNRCTETNRKELNSYLMQNPVLNLFLIGDLENFGFDSDLCDFYMDCDEYGISAVYLRFMKNLLLASQEQRLDFEAIQERIVEDQIVQLSGERTLMKKINFPEFYRRRECQFAQLSTLAPFEDRGLVRRLGEADLDALLALEDACFEGRNPELDGSKESLKREYEVGSGRCYGCFVDGKLVSAASSTAECKGLAMVVQVCTDRKYRGNGYATACIQKLSAELLQEGKTPCLFYDNPDAARIYKAVGYQDVGGWTMLERETL